MTTAEMTLDWSDQGIVLAARPHGETSAVVEALTRAHGRHLGLVRGGRSRRHRPMLQPGNVVSLEWRARLSEHLGNYTVELIEARAARVLDDATALAGLSTLCALARLLPERDPHAALYEGALLVLEHGADIDIWPGLLVRWELQLLGELGFGLDLATCAAGGARDDLAYVSPRTGRAVSRAAGAPYHERLLPLPGFLRNGGNGPREAGVGQGRLLQRGAGPAPVPTRQDVLDGFALTGQFLEAQIFAPRGLAMPEPRARMLAGLKARLAGT